MDEEFYHKDLFGMVVDFTPTETEVEERVVGAGRQSEFNVFALTDAIGGRKKKDAWILYHKALAAGLSAEEIFFKIVWQVKSMLIAAKTKDVSETEMKPFPYSKAKSFLKNFKEGELEKISQELVEGYAGVRQGKGEMETFVEKTLLRL